MAKTNTPRPMNAGQTRRIQIRNAIFPQKQIGPFAKKWEEYYNISYELSQTPRAKQRDLNEMSRMCPGVESSDEEVRCFCRENKPVSPYWKGIGETKKIYFPRYLNYKEVIHINKAYVRLEAKLLAEARLDSADASQYKNIER
jgi:hypothetical protein